MMATIDWVNRGDDGFDEAYGANASVARSIVDRAIRDWEQVIVDFNYSDGGNRFELSLGAMNVYRLPDGNLPYNPTPQWDSADAGSNDPMQDSEIGKPRKRRVFMDDNGAEQGWYFDPMVRNGPYDVPHDAEFDQVLNTIAARGDIAGRDFYRAALAVVGSAVGLTLGTYAEVFEAPGANKRTPLAERLVDTGVPYPADSSFSLKKLDLGSGGSATFVSGWLYDGPVNEAMHEAGLQSHDFDIMTARHLAQRDENLGIRSLISDLDAEILRDVYGYAVRMPSQINTFHANYSYLDRELVVTGTRGNDTIELNWLPGAQPWPMLEVIVNDTSELIPARDGAIEAIRIVGGEGIDEIRIYRAPDVSSIVIDAGAGDDSIVLGRDEGRFYELNASSIRIVGGEGHDTALILDNASVEDQRPYIISGTAFTREGDQTVVGLEAIEQFNVTTNSRGTVMRFGDIPSGVALSIFDHGGNDLLSFGEEQGNTLDGSSGRFTYEKALGAGGVSAAFFRDEASLSDADYQLTAPGAESKLTRGSASWNFRGVGDFILNAGIGHSTFEVFSTAQGTTWTINAGGGNDELLVTPQRTVSPLGFPITVGGDLAAHRASLAFVGGSGDDRVTADDRLSSVARAFTIDDDRLDWLGSPGINLTSVQAITVLGGGQSDTFDVGGGDLVANMRADVTIDGGGGVDEVTVDDLNATVGGGYVFRSNTVDGVPIEGVFRKSYPILNGELRLTTGDVTTRAIETMTLHGSQLDDGFSVNATPVGQSLVLEGNGGEDHFTIRADKLRSRVDVKGGAPTKNDLPPLAHGDTLELIGEGADTAVYTPLLGTDSGWVTVNGQMVGFTGLEPVYASGFAEFKLVTPRSQDIVTIDRAARESWLDPEDRWTRISGTSGVTRIGFEELYVRDVTTLVLDVATNDLTLDPAPLAPQINPFDQVTILSGAIEGTLVDVLRVETGVGGDIVDDYLMQGGLATGTLQVSGLAAGTQHRVRGELPDVRIVQTSPTESRLEARDSLGRLRHSATQQLVSVVTLPDSQQRIEFSADNVNLQLERGGDGRQRLRSGGASVWEFLPGPSGGQLDIVATGNSTIAFDTVLTAPPIVHAGPGQDVLSIVAPQLLEYGVQLRGFDSQDTVRLLTDTIPGEPNYFGIDLKDPESASFDIISDARLSDDDLVSIPDLPMPRARLRGEIFRTELGELPALEAVGSPDASQNLAVVMAPDESSSSSGIRPTTNIVLTSIELLVLIGPELSTQPSVDGLSTLVGSRNDVLVRADTSLDEVHLDTRTGPTDVGGRAEVTASSGTVAANDVTIRPYARELMVHSGPGDVVTLDQYISRAVDPSSSLARTVERILAGNWTVVRELSDESPLITRLESSRTMTAFGDGEYPQDLNIRHVLTGSASSFDIQGTFLGRVTLAAEGADGAENRIAVAVHDADFLRGMSLDIEGPSTGSTTVFIGETGVHYGSDGGRNIDLATGGSETRFFQGSSNVRAGLGGSLETDVQVEGGLATVLSATRDGSSPVDLFGAITTLRPLADDIVASFESTIDLLRPQLSIVGRTPVDGVDGTHSLDIQGTGSVSIGATDETSAGTDVHVDTTGGLQVFREGNVTVRVPALDGAGIDLEGPLHVCKVTNTNDAGPGSLRAALECGYGASSEALAIVTFAIPATDPNFVDIDSHLPGGDAEPDAFLILPLSTLPTNFRGRVLILGQSQQNLTQDSNAFGPEIVLAGYSAGSAASGLTIASSDNRIHGLNIQGFGGGGVTIVDGSDNVIGTNGDGINDAAEGNLIAYNSVAGVRVVGDTSRGNSIRANSIFSNAGLGVDLGHLGVTPNDRGDLARRMAPDTDQGPNMLQNFPEIASVQPGSQTQVVGILRSTPGASFLIDFYASESADPSGHGEGQRWLGSTTVQANSGGVAQFNAMLPGATFRGEWIAATATRLVDADGDQATPAEIADTSEFSAAREIRSGSSERASVALDPGLMAHATVNDFRLLSAMLVQGGALLNQGPAANGSAILERQRIATDSPTAARQSPSLVSRQASTIALPGHSQLTDNAVGERGLAEHAIGQSLQRRERRELLVDQVLAEGDILRQEDLLGLSK